MVSHDGKKVWRVALARKVPYVPESKFSWIFGLEGRTNEERFTRFFTD
jgi:hypothetical protein